MEKEKSELHSVGVRPLLSAHLFWDIDRLALDFEANKKFIIQRVLEYGLLSDWMAILYFYGKDEIVKTTLMLRSLDKRALAFMSAYAGIPKEEFTCYTTRQSIPPLWNY